MRVAFLACVVWCLTGAVVSAQEAAEVVYADDFEKGMDHWEPAGGEPSFEIVEVDGPDGAKSHALRAKGNSKYEPDYRSPPNIAILKDVNVGDFELDVKVLSTRPEAGPHRDLCIVWGLPGSEPLLLRPPRRGEHARHQQLPDLRGRQRRTDADYA